MIKFIDADNAIHYHPKEDIVHVELHPEEMRTTTDDQGNVIVRYYGHIAVSKYPHFINLSGEGAILAGKQFDKLMAAELDNS